MIHQQSVVTYLAAKAHYRYGSSGSSPEERQQLRHLLAGVGLMGPESGASSFLEIEGAPSFMSKDVSAVEGRCK